MEISYWRSSGDKDIWVVEKEETSSEEIVREACREILEIGPATRALFDLRYSESEHWFLPNEIPPKECGLLNVRLRFKVPSPGRLYSMDPRAFAYYYSQVREDFERGLVTKKGARSVPEYHSRSVWLPIIEVKPGGGNGGGASGGKSSYFSDHYASANKLTSLNILIDHMRGGKSLKDSLKNIESYAPKGLWLASVDRFFGKERFKKIARNLIMTWQSQKKSLLSLQMEFLTLVEEQYPGYFEETFSDVQGASSSNGVDFTKVTLRIRPPFLSALDSSSEIEPELLMKEGKREIRVCGIEEICNVTLKEQSEEIQVYRKNGVPAYFRFKDSRDRIDLLTLLCGYYRLTEKWIFSLSNDVVYPSLQFLLSFNIHGPVRTDFVDKKFLERAGSCATASNLSGYHIINQDPDVYDRYFIHLSDSRGKRTNTYMIYKYYDTKYSVSPMVEGLEGCSDLGEVILTLKRQFKFGRCLHPSEFDKDARLLLCRSVQRLQSDISHSWHGESVSTVFVPFRSLRRFENEKFAGSFTNVWKGQWLKAKGQKETVAIKQLKSEYEPQYLKSFLNMSNKIMTCSDSTIVSVLGFFPSFLSEPTALILEYFFLGSLDGYLQRNSESLTVVELLEASARLARALWYLSEQRIVHGKFRCRAVFVQVHKEGSFVVKLGDPGIPEYSLDKDSFWLPVEVIASEEPLYLLSEYPETDVWGYATTLWEIFSFGKSPKFEIDNGEAIVNRILKGERLDKPEIFGRELRLGQIYALMRRCWYPDPTLRSSPQQILKDVNQLFYRVFNSRTAHDYVTISESGNRGKTEQVSDNSLREVASVPKQFSTPSTPPSFTSSYYPASISGSQSMDPLISPEAAGSSEYGSYLDSQTTSIYTTYFSQSQCTSIYSFGKNQLELNQDRPIGEGHFGIVFRGTLSRSCGDWDEVAVKMLKDQDQGSDADRDMMAEFELMKELHHDNVVKIKGTLRESDRVIIVMEYLREGSLDKYLVLRESILKEDRGIRLFKYAHDIADGMEYLASKNIIHRDLAARNILVADEDTVKISDFGLARVSSDYYIMSSSSNIPIKWLAPECLTKKIYSVASDVWAFGVTLWEMFSFGKVPNLDGCESFFEKSDSENKHFLDMQRLITALLDGRRLPKTEDIPISVYNELLLPCWESDYRKRPNFTALKKIISSVELKVT